MSYYCDICDKTIKIHYTQQFRKSIHIIHSSDNPKFFEADDI